MPVRECIKKMTHREYMAWHAFIGIDSNEPNRSDHYAMQIAAEIRSIFRNNVKMDEFKIKFTQDKPGKRRKATPEERERASQIAKAAWAARLGSAIRKTDGSTQTHRPLNR